MYDYKIDIGNSFPKSFKIYEIFNNTKLSFDELEQNDIICMPILSKEFKFKKKTTRIIQDNGIESIIKIITNTGKTLIASEDTKIFTILETKKLKDLKIGDKIATISRIPIFGDRNITLEETIILAYMIADGNCTSNTTIRFTNSNKAIINELEQCVKVFGCKLIKYKSSRKYDYNIIKAEHTHNRMYKNGVIELLKKYKLLGKGAHEKSIPKEIMNSNKEIIQLFLSRIYSNDGWATISGNRMEIGYSSVSIALIEDIKKLLLKFGISSTICRKKVKYKNTRKLSYSLMIYNSPSIIKFYDNIGIFQKEEKLKEVYRFAIEKIDKSNANLIPKDIFKIINEDRERQELKKSELCETKNARIRDYYDVSRDKVLHYGEVLKNQYLVNIAKSDIIYEKIDSVEGLDECNTFGIGIPLWNNLIINEIVVYTTGNFF